MIKILKHLKLKEWLLILVSIGFLALQTFLDLKLPDYMTEITLRVGQGRHGDIGDRRVYALVYAGERCGRR